MLLSRENGATTHDTGDRGMLLSRGMALRHMIQEKGDAAVTGNGATTHDTGDWGMLLSWGMAL